MSNTGHQPHSESSLHYGLTSQVTENTPSSLVVREIHAGPRSLGAVPNGCPCQGVAAEAPVRLRFFCCVRPPAP